MDGGYILPNLAIGPYTLEVSKEGFSKYIQSGIVLQVDANPTIDASLKVGAVNEQVTVEANAALVETRSTGVGQVIDNTRVVEMPLNGRQVTESCFRSGHRRTDANAGRPKLSHRLHRRSRRLEQRPSLPARRRNPQRSA